MMKKLRSVYASFTKRPKKKTLKTMKHEDIKDIDIRINTETMLKFRKVPWFDLLMGAFCAVIALGFAYFQQSCIQHSALL